jgi:hypothetical protein
MPPAPPLSPRRERFCAEYVATNYDRTEAYRRAYPNAKTKHAQETGANRLLRNGPVLARIAELQQAAMDRCNVDADKIIAGLLKEATYYDSGASHGARVAAWAHLARIRGLTDGGERGNVNTVLSITQQLVVVQPGERLPPGVTLEEAEAALAAPQAPLVPIPLEDEIPPPAPSDGPPA